MRVGAEQTGMRLQRGHEHPVNRAAIPAQSSVLLICSVQISGVHSLCIVMSSRALLGFAHRPCITGARLASWLGQCSKLIRIPLTSRCATQSTFPALRRTSTAERIRHSIHTPEQGLFYTSDSTCSHTTTWHSITTNIWIHHEV